SGRRGRRSPRRKGARTSWPSVDIRASVRTGSLPAANQARHAGRRSAEVGEVKRLLVAFTGVAALALPAAASAHPLGNFTVNRFSRIEVAGPRVYVHYVLDLAEIPTFQAGTIDARGYARRIARGAWLTVSGRRARLVPVEWALAHPNGAGGLKTTRLEVVLRGPALRARSN